MTFTAIDFETAHAQFPCEIGLCRVEGGEIIEVMSRLIKPACFPYMNPWCQKVHGIAPSELQSENTFEEIWGELRPWLEDTVLVAHNAAFDMNVLRSSLRHYDLATPHSDYLCSVSLSRKIWKGLPSYKLNSLCDMFDIRFRHHRAGADAEACAKLVLKAGDDMGAPSLENLLALTGVKLKRL
ncbi:MAG: Exonuclease RNase and polymerase [Bacteroidetes bacterium]|nr:Exonuclease RNase and polymerase [Bacteroidota bacterium]